MILPSWLCYWLPVFIGPLLIWARICHPMTKTRLFLPVCSLINNTDKALACFIPVLHALFTSFSLVFYGDLWPCLPPRGHPSLPSLYELPWWGFHLHLVMFIGYCDCPNPLYFYLNNKATKLIIISDVRFCLCPSLTPPPSGMTSHVVLDLTELPDKFS